MTHATNITAYVTQAEQELIAAKVTGIHFADYPAFEQTYRETDNTFLISAWLLCEKAEAERFLRLIKEHPAKFYILYAEQTDETVFDYLYLNEAGKQIYRSSKTQDDFLDADELVEWLEGRKKIEKDEEMKGNDRNPHQRRINHGPHRVKPLSDTHSRHNNRHHHPHTPYWTRICINSVLEQRSL